MSSIKRSAYRLTQFQRPRRFFISLTKTLRRSTGIRAEGAKSAFRSCFGASLRICAAAIGMNLFADKPQNRFEISRSCLERFRIDGQRSPENHERGSVFG